MLKKLAIAAAVIVVIIIALMIALKLAINPENYRGQIIEQAEKALNGRNVEIGKIELKLIGFGVKIEKLVVDNREGFSPDERFIDVELVEVRVGILSLLTNTINVKKIALIQPRIYAERNKKGEFSFDDLVSAEEEAEKEKPEAEEEPVPTPPKKGKNFLVNSLEIERGQLTFDDMKSPTGEYVSFQVEQLDVNVSNLSLEEVIGLDISAAIRSESQEKNFFLKGKIGPLGEELDFKETHADMAIKFHPFKISFLQPYYTEYLPYIIESGILDVDLNVSGKASEGLKTGGKIGIRELAYSDKQRTWGPTEKFDLILEQEGLARLDEKSLKLEKGFLNIGGMILNLEGRGEVTDDGLKFQAKAMSDKFQLKPLMDIIGPVRKMLDDMGIELSGESALALTASSDAKTMDASVDLVLDGAKILYPGVLRKVPGEQCQLNLKIKLTDKAYILDKILARLTALELSANGNIGTQKGMPANLEFKTNPVPLNTFKSNLILIKDYTLDGNLELSGKINGSLEDTQRLTVELAKAEFTGTHSDIHLKGSITGLETPDFNFELRSNNLDLDKIMAGLQAEEKEDTAKETKEEPGKEEQEKSILAEASGRGSIRMDKVIYEGELIENIKADISMTRGLLSSRNMGLDVAGGDISMPLTLDFRKKDIGYEFSPKFKNLDINRILTAFTDLDNAIHGTGNGNMTLKGYGTDWEKVSGTLKGSGSMKLKDGSIKNVDLVGSLLGDWATSDKLNKLGKLALGKHSFEKSKETRFEKMALDFDMDKGEIKVKECEIKHDQGVFDLRGKADLKYHVRLHGRVSFNKEASRDFAKRMGISPETPGLFDCSGRLVLALFAKGKYPEDVRISLDGKEYGKIINENLKCGLKDKLLEEGQKLLEEEGKKLLDDLFNP
jgi:hypothetical protein